MLTQRIAKSSDTRENLIDEKRNINIDGCSIKQCHWMIQIRQLPRKATIGRRNEIHKIKNGLNYL